MYSLFASWHSHFETHEIKNEKSFWRSFSSTFVEDFREAQFPLFSLAVMLSFPVHIPRSLLWSSGIPAGPPYQDLFQIRTA